MSCHSTHCGVAATYLARVSTSLDDSQAASIFHRLKREHADSPAPTADEVQATLRRMDRDLDHDTRLDERQRNRLRDRYQRAIGEARNGTVPDGATWNAFTATPVEAEIAEANLDAAIRAAARTQGRSVERQAAVFRNWRRRTDYEVIEAPDERFRIDTSQMPTDKHTRRALTKMGFESYLAQPLPVFTYGTLRRGQGNERLMANAITYRSEQAHIDGVAIYGANRGFPYAQEAPDGHGITRGDLVHLSDDQTGAWARESLDTLEGFDSDTYDQSHYRRVGIDVTYVDEATGQTRTTHAWTYLAGAWAREDLHERDRIHDGDWVKAKDAYRATRSTARPWWEDHRSESTPDDSGEWDGDYVVVKSSTDPGSGSSTGSARASAAVFEALDPD